MINYPCLRIKQWGYGEGAQPGFIYLTSMPIKSLWKADIDRWTKENREGYQREPMESRFGTGRGSIVRYLLREIGAFPTSILINVRGDIKYEPKVKVSDAIELGEIRISDDAKLIIIDGQHRFEALKRASEQKPELENYPLPVSIMNFKDKFDEMVYFYIVNSRQKSIPTDLVYRQLQIFSEKVVLGGRGWLKEVILGPAEQRKALASFIVDYLDENPNSPFSGRIQYTAEKKEEHHLVRDFVLARFLTKILTEKALSGLSPEVFADVLAEYWSAIKELYPDCFKRPAGYTLLKTTGIACFTYMFPTIFAYCAREGNVTKARFKHYLSMLKEELNVKELPMDYRRPMDESWWSAAYGPSIARATSETIFGEIVANMAKKIEMVMKSKGEK